MGKNGHEVPQAPHAHSCPSLTLCEAPQVLRRAKTAMQIRKASIYAILRSMDKTLPTSSSCPNSSPHSVLMAHCPSRQVLDLIADKWTALIFSLLERQPTRFNEMERAIEGISHKMLTQTLRNLEHRGIVERKITPTVPPSVEYSLSPLGATLIPLMATLRQWAEEHMEEVEQARQAYEEREGKTYA